jgi:aryl-alcohol dehydrogenase-like predicted oxidoreductase
VSTKFGILPAKTSLIKEAIKPIARKILNIAPGARKAVQKQIGAQFSGNKFSVSVLRESLDTSLRKLGTDYVDFLFMHSAPATVLEQADLIDELEKMVSAGKVRSAGISSEYEVIEAALNTQIPVLQSFQFPCNVFDLRTTRRFVGRQSEFVAVANHPFGGVERAVQSKARLEAIAANFDTPAELQEKLRVVDEFVLADIVLNAILSGTGIQVVVPSMIQSTHLKANINAMENSRFQPNELAWLRQALSPQ